MTRKLVAERELKLAPETSDTTRVAVREVREITWRALVAGGVSPGESAVIADAVTFAEVHFAEGLSFVNNALNSTSLPHETIHHGNDNAAIVTLRGTNDGMCPNLIPLAMGLVAARPASVPVFAQHQSWTLAIAGFLAQHCGNRTPDFYAFEMSENGLLRGIRAGADHSMTLYETADLSEAQKLNPRLKQTSTVTLPGVLFTTNFSGVHGLGPGQTQSASELSTRRRHAVKFGIAIPTEVWEPIYKAAETYLVADK